MVNRQQLKQYGIVVPAKGLSDRWIERAARPLPFGYLIYDARQVGLGLMVRPSGRKTWILQARYPNARSQARRVLGHYPGLGLAEARRLASEWRALVHEGRDPAELKEEKRRTAEVARLARAAADANTLAGVLKRYSSEILSQQRRGAAVRRELGHLLPEWGTRPIGSISPTEIKRVIGAKARVAPYQARNIYGGLTTMMRWAVFEELLPTSPCASLSTKLLFRGADLAPRQRVLNNDELAAFWRSANKLGYPYAAIYKLLLLTGCRHGEISRARWSELHPQLRQALRTRNYDWATLPAAAKVLVIPSARFKSGVEHRVQLSDAALSVLAELPLLNSSSDFFLFSSTLGQTPINVAAAAKLKLDARMLRGLRALARRRHESPEAVRLQPFVIHDLRRTVRTGLSAMNVDDVVAEMVLGHGRKGIARTYDQHKYFEQQRAALEAWAQRLRSIVSPTPPAPSADNVVRLNKLTSNKQKAS